MVPMPESVKISSSTECGSLPSSTWACGTPPRTAFRQASILGIMPLARPGSSRSRPVAVSVLITSPGWPVPSPSAGQPAYRPATSVSTTSLAAPSATASTAAAVSALTLYTSPPVPRATLDTTGIRPSAIRARAAAGSTVSISPTSPMSTGVPSTTGCRLRAVNMFASSPDMPTANGPCRLIRPTTSRLTWPVSTMRTTSMVSGVVTRSPAVNVLSRPSRARCAEICGPPPCTQGGRRPRDRRKRPVWGDGGARRGVGHGVPAVLDHHGLAVEPVQPRQRLDEDRRLGGSTGPGGRPPGTPASLRLPRLRRGGLGPAGPGGHRITQGTPLDPRWPGTPDGLWPRSLVTRPWPGRLEWRASGGRGGLRARGRGHVEYAEFSWTYSVVRSVVRIVAAAGPADRSTVIVTSRGLRSTLDLSSAAQPLRHTHTPLIATLIRSGSNAASVVPTADSTRPQFGSAPAMAHLSRADR